MKLYVLRLIWRFDSEKLYYTPVYDWFCNKRIKATVENYAKRIC